LNKFSSSVHGHWAKVRRCEKVIQQQPQKLYYCTLGPYYKSVLEQDVKFKLGLARKRYFKTKFNFCLQVDLSLHLSDSSLSWTRAVF